jgi:hypothetical protein
LHEVKCDKIVYYESKETLKSKNYNYGKIGRGGELSAVDFLSDDLNRKDL